MPQGTQKTTVTGGCMKKELTSTLQIKRNNRRKVLRYILSHDAISRQEIAQGLGISTPTVLQNVNELMQMGLVRDAGQYESTGGRKAGIVAANADAVYSVGIEITRNHIGMVLVDLAGHLVCESRESCVYCHDADYYYRLGTAVEHFTRQSGIHCERIGYAGISIPGILDHEKKVITDSHVLELARLDCTVFQELLPWPCSFENDANAAGYAELRDLSAEGTMIYLSLSNSVGGAIYQNGVLLPGSEERGGEFGHMRIVPEGRLCYCGQTGCLDAYCSALRLTEQTDGNLEQFFEEISHQNPKLMTVWQDYLHWLSYAVINLRMIFDGKIILGGYVGGYLAPYLDSLRDQVRRMDPFGHTGDYLFCGKYRQLASAYGAALRPLDTFLESI